MYISDNAELAENKLTILYISKSIGLPLSNTRLSQIITDGKFFNFFLLQHLLEDLISKGYINKDEMQSGEASYLITPKGSETLTFLMHKLPKGVRRDIDKLTSDKASLIRNDRDIVAYFLPEENGNFISVLEIKDAGDLLFSIKYTSGSKNDAVMICDKLKAQAETLYNDITNIIIT